MAEEPPLDTVFPPCERPSLRRGPTRVITSSVAPTRRDSAGDEGLAESGLFEAFGNRPGSGVEVQGGLEDGA